MRIHPNSQALTYPSLASLELEYSCLHQFRAVELFREREDRGRFTCPWGPVEEHVREIAGLKGT